MPSGQYTRAFPLHAAAYDGDAGLCAELIDIAGIEVDCRDIGQFTALHHASENGHASVCRMLLDRGANINARDKNDRTPLIWLVAGARFCPLASIDQEALPGESYILSEKRTADVCKILIAEGAEIGAHTGDGTTALHMASYRGNESVCKLLVQHGGVLDAADGNGNTPATLARMAGRLMLADCLQNSEKVRHMKCTGPGEEHKLVWEPPQSTVSRRGPWCGNETAVFMQEMQQEWAKHISKWHQYSLIALTLKKRVGNLQVGPLVHILGFVIGEDEVTTEYMLSCFSELRIAPDLSEAIAIRKYDSKGGSASPNVGGGGLLSLLSYAVAKSLLDLQDGVRLRERGGGVGHVDSAKQKIQLLSSAAAMRGESGCAWLHEFCSFLDGRWAEFS
jgi:hypothetical protein